MVHSFSCCFTVYFHSFSFFSIQVKFSESIVSPDLLHFVQNSDQFFKRANSEKKNKNKNKTTNDHRHAQPFLLLDYYYLELQELTLLTLFNVYSLPTQILHKTHSVTSKMASSEKQSHSSTSFETQRDQLVQEIALAMDSVVYNLETLNRSLADSVLVGKDFEGVASLWSTFYDGARTKRDLGVDAAPADEQQEK